MKKKRSPNFRSRLIHLSLAYPKSVFSYSNSISLRLSTYMKIRAIYFFHLCYDNFSLTDYQAPLVGFTQLWKICLFLNTFFTFMSTLLICKVLMWAKMCRGHCPVLDMCVLFGNHPFPVEIEAQCTSFCWLRQEGLQRNFRGRKVLRKSTLWLVKWNSTIHPWNIECLFSLSLTWATSWPVKEND